jgi:tRNA modification GTPase
MADHPCNREGGCLGPSSALPGSHVFNDTIVAVSTPPGRGGIGIVRICGPLASELAQHITGRSLSPRSATYCGFTGDDGEFIDQGIAVFYPGPHSYTGDDCVELQAHGNPLLLERLISFCCTLGARLARPGEFTERAFRNDKLDLAQAEAVADVIASQSQRALRSAQRTLNGDFARLVNELIHNVQIARAELEASIDFADDLIADHLLAQQQSRIQEITETIQNIVNRAKRGSRLRSGASIAIVGAPNVGKSSLLNRLAEQDRAIVSDQPGTTRDLLDADIVVNGLPIRLIDTAGLRMTNDDIEQQGIARAHAELKTVDLALLVVDQPGPIDAVLAWQELGLDVRPSCDVIIVHNKIDAHAVLPRRDHLLDPVRVYVSALTGDGVDLLAEAITDAMGLVDGAESEFSAHTRHLDALNRAAQTLQGIAPEILVSHPEIAAEHYREATLALETIGGRYSSEDLLGDIFSRFCIGK